MSDFLKLLGVLASAELFPEVFAVFGVVLIFAAVVFFGYWLISLYGLTATIVGVLIGTAVCGAIWLLARFVNDPAREANSVRRKVERARKYYAAGDLKAAHRQLRSALRLHSHYPEIWAEYRFVLFLQKRWAELVSQLGVEWQCVRYHDSIDEQLNVASTSWLARSYAEGVEVAALELERNASEVPAMLDSNVVQHLIGRIDFVEFLTRAALQLKDAPSSQGDALRFEAWFFAGFNCLFHNDIRRAESCLENCLLSTADAERPAVAAALDRFVREQIAALKNGQIAPAADY